MTIHQPTQTPLQQALFKAAKVGHISLMREFVEAGADPFALDEKNRSVIQYAIESDPADPATLLMQLTDIINLFNNKRKKTHNKNLLLAAPLA